MISIKDLEFYYRRSKRLFKDVSLEVEAGKIIGLLGRNGEGKSTLMKLIVGQLLAKKGEVKTLGHNASEREVELLQQVYILPEEVELPNMSVKEYLSVFGSFYPTYDEALAHELVKAFDISLEMNLKQMSLGQKKKAAIVLAIALRTPVLLMDEPTNGLDIPSKSLFRRIMARYIQEEQTVIISTHQVRDLEQLIDHILLLEKNKIICNASIKDLSDRLAFDQVKGGTDRTNLLYSEPSIAGEFGVFKREDELSDGEFAMELFFNAMVAAPTNVLNTIADINYIK